MIGQIGRGCPPESSRAVHVVYVNGSLLLLQAPCCKKYYSCRICHDEKESHKLDRTKVSKLKCLNCDMENEVRLDGCLLQL